MSEVANVTSYSVVTLNMIREWMHRFDIDLNDTTQYAGVIGSLVGLELGDGEFPDDLRGTYVFRHLEDAYDAAKARKSE